MTLDEAIEHAEERACGNDKCAKDHVQLADWLRELRQARLTIDILKIFRDGFKEDAQKYKAENEKLRELLRRYGEYTDQDRCEGCAFKSRCNDGDVGECWQLTEIRELARKLNVEVEE